MKGFVPTPKKTVDEMITRLFIQSPPTSDSSLLDPGCGTGEFIDGVLRWCERHGMPIPQITGVESDPQHIPVLRKKYENLDAVTIKHADFLTGHKAHYDFIVGNPPYVPITALSEEEKITYRGLYKVARGRFDLYLLFFEQALQSLKPEGRLVFITPEKYLYVDSAAPFRSLLSGFNVEEIVFMADDTFGELVTYPAITVVSRSTRGMTYVRRRDFSSSHALLTGSDSWLPRLQQHKEEDGAIPLAELCIRVSCGIATGADGIFVRQLSDLDPALRRFAFPTVAGRQLMRGTIELPQSFGMLTPYDSQGRLLAVEDLGVLGEYLERPENKKRLMARTCVRHKPWYAFHETPLLYEILRPKILCKDICEQPHFWLDQKGSVVPRHSIYYIVPKNPRTIDLLVKFLNSEVANTWLNGNCQRASKGYLRLQSRVLQRLPVPREIAEAILGEPIGMPAQPFETRPKMMAHITR